MGTIDVEGLWYTYPNVTEPALRDINLKIKSGEFILLTGPSGCGKTTFCRCLNGLIPHFYNGEMHGRHNWSTDYTRRITPRMSWRSTSA